MPVRRLLIAALLMPVASVWADPPLVQDFRITYRVAPGQTVAQEGLRGVQRAASLQSLGGEALAHRRTSKDGVHEMRASRTMTRAEAWAFSEKLRRDNPEVAMVEPVDPEAHLVEGRKPNAAGGQP